MEEILLDVWESQETREEALSRLRYVCRTKDTDDGFLCYTWGLIEYNRGNFTDSYTAFTKASEKNPQDSLYKNMVRLSAERSGNLKHLKQKSKEGEVMARFTETTKICQSGGTPDKDEFFYLAKEGVLTKESLRRGILAECFTKLEPTKQAEVIQSLPQNSISYRERLLADQMKSDPYHKIWDTRSFHSGELGKEKEDSKIQITQSWRKLKEAAKSGNESSARNSLRIFLAEIANAKRRGKAEANLALALERSAKLLLEQDPSYVQVRHLAKEF
ncbi:hypothetical protein P3G55_06460 [Leptospira sp. 96542]|nr:hypothetical protein [Leptospira sp. 96542]